MEARTLLVMRHAKSSWSTGVTDHERPLNARGRADAPRMAAALRELGWIPDHVLCSDAERTRRAINAEREEIDRASKALNDDRARLQTSTETAVNAFNAKAAAVDARIADWNRRNQAWNDAGSELEDTRKTWVANCGDRRYREDDEIAIKRGK